MPRTHIACINQSIHQSTPKHKWPTQTHLGLPDKHDAGQASEGGIALCPRIDDGVISEEDFVLLYDVNTGPDLPDYPRFNLDDMTEGEFVAEFRVRKADLPVLAEVLRIPERFTLPQRSVAGGMEGLDLLVAEEADLSLSL